MSSRSPRTASALVILAFAAFLLGTSKKKEPPPPAPGSPSSSTTPPAKPAGWVAPPVRAAKTAAPPATDDWHEVKVSKAKLAVRIPEGASVADDAAGHDPSFAGSWFRVKMPSGYDIYFAEQSGSEKIDIAVEKRHYQLEKREKIDLAFDAADAIVVNRNGPPPAGAYCEVTACGRLGGRPLCASHAGALVDGQEVKKLTSDECLSTVAIARSIRAL